MSTFDYLIDTNILIYHTKGLNVTINFLQDVITHHSFNISIITKIEFLGWDKHTLEGYQKCKDLIDSAYVYSVDNNIANKAIDLKRKCNIKLADAIIASTALLNKLKISTRNIEDFKTVEGLDIVNPFG